MYVDDGYVVDAHSPAADAELALLNKEFNIKFVAQRETKIDHRTGKCQWEVGATEEPAQRIKHIKINDTQYSSLKTNAKSIKIIGINKKSMKRSCRLGIS